MPSASAGSDQRSRTGPAVSWPIDLAVLRVLTARFLRQLDGAGWLGTRLIVVDANALLADKVRPAGRDHEKFFSWS